MLYLQASKATASQELAAKCNFEKSNLSRIEAGRTNVTIRTLYKINTALGVKLYDLLNLERYEANQKIKVF